MRLKNGPGESDGESYHRSKLFVGIFGRSPPDFDATGPYFRAASGGKRTASPPIRKDSCDLVIVLTLQNRKIYLVYIEPRRYQNKIQE